jgi:hypothetical protein
VSAYAECQICCTACTASEWRAEQWADEHEDLTGHNVKIFYGEECS